MRRRREGVTDGSEGVGDVLLCWLVLGCWGTGEDGDRLIDLGDQGVEVFGDLLEDFYDC